MARYRCLRTVDFDGGRKNSGKKFVPGMVHVGDEPKCGKGTSLLEAKSYYNKKGKKVEIPPAFELIAEPKPKKTAVKKKTTKKKKEA